MYQPSNSWFHPLLAQCNEPEISFIANESYYRRIIFILSLLGVLISEAQEMTFHSQGSYKNRFIYASFYCKFAILVTPKLIESYRQF